MADKPETQDKIERAPYNKLELAFRNTLIEEMYYAQTQRNQNHVEFDDMDYITYWRTNVKAGNAYMPPKSDPEDVRVTTGTTLEKKNTLLNNLLNLNLEADVEAYDEKDQIAYEVGQTMEDMVRKSRKVEDYEDTKKIHIYNEFITQGTVCVEEKFNEYMIEGKSVGKDFNIEEESKMNWDKDISKVYAECSAELITGLNVYFGNIREQDLERQPFMILRRVLTYSEAKSLYGKWARFKYVPKTFNQFYTDDQVDDVAYNNFTLEEYQKNMVEEIRYFNKWTNDFMILLNGVMMFPVRENGTFPLSGILGVCEYPIAYAVAEPITNFVYGKATPAKTKTEQALMDEMFKALVIKTRKSYNPPLANNTGETISKRVLWAGHITDDVNPEKLQPIGDNAGVSSSEFQALQFIKGIIDNKTVDPVMEGQSSGQRTAREIEEMKKQSMIGMGLIIMGITTLERRMAQLRIYNIMKNWTKPMQEGMKDKIYRTVSMKTDFENGETGTREIEFTENLPDETQVYAEEELKKQITGKAFRKVYIDPKVFKNMKYKWFIEITPTQKQSNALRQAQFEESVQKALAIFAPLGKMPNMEYLGKKWATNQGEDPEQFWQAEQQMNPMQGGMPPGGGQPPPNQVGGQMTPDAMPKPSVNTMQGA